MFKYSIISTERSEEKKIWATNRNIKSLKKDAVNRVKYLERENRLVKSNLSIWWKTYVIK